MSFINLLNINISINNLITKVIFMSILIYQLIYVTCNMFHNYCILCAFTCMFHNYCILWAFTCMFHNYCILWAFTCMFHNYCILWTFTCMFHNYCILWTFTCTYLAVVCKFLLSTCYRLYFWKRTYVFSAEMCIPP